MKKLLKIAMLALCSITLSACNFSLDMFHLTGGQTSQKGPSSLVFTTTKSEVELQVGGKFTLRASYAPEDYVPDNITWTSSNEGVVSLVEDETSPLKASVTGLSGGTTKVTLSVDSKSVSITFKVPVGTLDTLEVSGYQTVFEVGDSFNFGGTVTANYTNKEVKDVTSKATFSGYDLSKSGNQNVTVSYTDSGKTATTAYPIVVYKAGEKPVIEKTDLNYTFGDLSDQSAYDLDHCPSTGSGKLLVIPVWFTNSNTYIPTEQRETVRDDIRKAYFGSEAETGWHSVKTFYETESRGALSLSGVVAPWYECGKASSVYYTSLQNTSSLVSEATDWYFKQSGVDPKTSFDCDNNGHLDGVMVIYAAPDMQAENNSRHDNMWAYCYWLQGRNANTMNPTPNVFFWASYDFMYGEAYKIGNYNNGDTSHCSIDAHTFIHEMGHVFGLDDYYDYSGTYNDAAGFSMQDNNVGGHDPYSCMALGWAKPYVPKETITIEIKPFQESGDLILLSPDFSTKSPFDEYILLELYTPTGLNKFDCDFKYRNAYPKGPKDVGIRMWHVNSVLYSYRYNELTTTIKNGGQYVIATSNTSSASDGHVPIGDYVDYSELFLMGRGSNSNHRKNNLAATDLWKTGDTFSMTNNGNFFSRKGKLDFYDEFGWSINFDIVSSTSALITVTKA